MCRGPVPESLCQIQCWDSSHLLEGQEVRPFLRLGLCTAGIFAWEPPGRNPGEPPWTSPLSATPGLCRTALAPVSLWN